MKLTFRDIRIINCWSLEKMANLYNLDAETLRESEDYLEFTDKKVISDILSQIGIDYEEVYSFDKIKDVDNMATI